MPKPLCHAFFCTSTTDMNLSRRLFFPTPRRSANVPALRSPIVLLESFPKFSSKLFFQNANGWMLQKFKHFFVQYQWMALEGWKEDRREMSSCRKWYWCQINEHKSCIGQKRFIFSKTFCEEKSNFCSVDADPKMSIARFPIGL